MFIIAVVVALLWILSMLCSVCFFFQAEDGIRDLVRSRGLGDVYKRQGPIGSVRRHLGVVRYIRKAGQIVETIVRRADGLLSLIHI